VENYKRNMVPNKEKGTLKFEGRVRKGCNEGGK
jgi:hypothetical protein